MPNLREEHLRAAAQREEMLAMTLWMFNRAHGIREPVPPPPAPEHPRNVVPDGAIVDLEAVDALNPFQLYDPFRIYGGNPIGMGQATRPRPARPMEGFIRPWDEEPNQSFLEQDGKKYGEDYS